MEKRMSKKASTWSPAVDHGWDSTLNLSPSTCCLFSSLKSEFQSIMHQIVSVRTVALFWVEKGKAVWCNTEEEDGPRCRGRSLFFCIWASRAWERAGISFFGKPVVSASLRTSASEASHACSVWGWGSCAGALAKASWLSPGSVKSCVHPWFPMHHEAEIKCRGLLRGIQYYRESLADLCIYIVWWCIDNDVSAMIV